MNLKQQFPSFKGISAGEWDEDSVNLVKKHCVDKIFIHKYFSSLNNGEILEKEFYNAINMEMNKNGNDNK